jgi:hypothetical protein
MQSLKPIGISANIILLGGVVSATCHVSSAVAAPPVQSDNTGFNVQTDNTGSNLNCRNTPEGCFKTEFSEDAKLIFKELEDARYRCTQYKTSIATAPRRFARGPSKKSEECFNTECEKLGRVVEKARTLLKEARSSQARLTANNDAW